MKIELVAILLAGAGAALTGCTVALDFSPSALLPPLDSGVRDESNVDASPLDRPATETAVDAPTADGACDADLTSDPLHCGQCDVQCGAFETCAAGRCTCAQGRADCDGQRTNGCEADLTTSSEHCGACGRACTGATACVAGACTGGAGCRAPMTMCGVQCVDLLSETRHCGACGMACVPGAPRCCNGVCAPRCT